MEYWLCNLGFSILIKEENLRPLLDTGFRMQKQVKE